MYNFNCLNMWNLGSIIIVFIFSFFVQAHFVAMSLNILRNKVQAWLVILLFYKLIWPETVQIDGCTSDVSSGLLWVPVFVEIVCSAHWSSWPEYSSDSLVFKVPSPKPRTWVSELVGGRGVVIWECGCIVVMCEGGMNGVAPQQAKASCRQPANCRQQGIEVVGAIQLPTACPGRLPGGGLQSIEHNGESGPHQRAPRTACQGRLPGGSP